MRYFFIYKAAASSVPVALLLLSFNGCLRARYQPCDDTVLELGAQKKDVHGFQFSPIFIRYTQSETLRHRRRLVSAHLATHG
jgi:hypothetical protein